MDDWELQASISYYSAAAIRLDSLHSGEAVKCYQYAIYALQELAYKCPDYQLQKVYLERSRAYENRIKALKMLSL